MKYSLLTIIKDILGFLKMDVSGSSQTGKFRLGQIGVEWGVVGITPSTPIGNLYYKDVAIAFKHKYKYVPYIGTSMRGSNYVATLYGMSLNETTAGCSIRVVSSNTTARYAVYLIIGILGGVVRNLIVSTRWWSYV